ncbi:MAG: autotransporter-associated beta strand repeat-containing protein [Verrucomicrobia bacterium]|nr:autotransporter-associated beta strand repeat-containing protein [Verrucomicrobiota bacterium]
MQTPSIHISRNQAPVPALLLLLLAAAALGLGPAARADYWVLGGAGDWNVATNWSGGVVPDNTIVAGAVGEVTNGTAIVSSTVPNVSEAWAGNNGIAGDIIVTNGGTLNVDNWLVAGRAGTGNTPLSRLIVENGVVNKTGDGFLVGDINSCRGELIVAGTGVVNVNGGWFGVGNGESGWGWVYLRDNAQLLLADGRDFNIGDWGTGRGWCHLRDHARIDVRRFWVGKNDTAGAMFQSGGVVQGFTPTANEWRIGEGASAYGFYSLTGGIFDNPNNLHIGATGKGLLYQSGGTNVEGGWCAPGRYAGGHGIVHLTGGRLVHTGTGTHLFCAEQGRGEINVAGAGVLDCNLSLVVAHAYAGATGHGTLNVNGGTVRVPRFERWGDAPGGLAYVNLNGGVIEAKAGEPAFLENMTDARVYAGGAIFDTAGYDITVNQPLLGATGNGVTGIPVLDGGSGYMGPPIVSITGDGSGATAVALMADDGSGAGAFRLDAIVITCPGHDYTNAPTVALLGGLPATAATLDTPTLGPVSSGGLTKLGSGMLTLGGSNAFAGPAIVNSGSLRLNVVNALSPTANANVALGAALDLNNLDQTVGSLSGEGNVALGSAMLACGADDSSTVFSGAITGDGGLIKSGSGALALTGPNHYGGPTAITSGRLVTTTASAATGDIRLADGTALGLEVLADNAQLHPANLELGSTTAVTLDLDLGAFGNPTNAPLDVAGTLAVNGLVTVNIAAANLAVGQFPLIHYGTRAGTGGFVVGTLPPRMLAEIVTNEPNLSIDLHVLSFDNPKWAGTVPGGVWDIGVTPNWVGASSGTPATYVDGDLVLFDDSAIGTTTVDLGTTVQPAGVTINNSSLAYTLTGTGKISGPNGVTKNGSDTYTVGNTGGNDYTGTTAVNAGTLAAGAANTLSPNSPIHVGGGRLDIQGYDQTVGAVRLASGAISGSGGTLSGASYDMLSGAVNANLGGAGALTKTAPGTVTLSGANTYSGDTRINEGTLAAGAANALSPNSAVTVKGGTLDLDGHDQAAGPVSLVAGAITGAATLTAPSFQVQSGLIAPNLTGPGALTKSGGGTAALEGDLSHAGGTIVNDGTLVLGGHNTYGGDTVLNGGVAVVSADANLGAGNIVLNPTGTLRVDGGTNFASARTLHFGVAAWNGGTIDVAEHSLAWFSGAMTGAGNDTYFYKEGPGTMVYSGVTAFDDATHFFANRGLLVFSNATVSVNRWSGVASAAGADATLALVGDSALTVVHDFNVGDVTPSRARFYIADNARLVCNAFAIGKPADCVGAAYQVGGTIVNYASWVADWRIGGQWGTGDVGAYGFYLLANGAMTNVINNWQVGAYAQGVYYQSGGINEQGGWTAFGRFGGSPSLGHGVGYLTGGQFIHSQPAQHVIVAEQGRGELTVAGTASVDLAGALWIGLDYDGLAGNGTVNLNGGTLATPAITMPGLGASSLLNLNGGSLRAKANEPNFLAGLSAACVHAGGAVIDSAGFDITVAQPLLAPDGDGVSSITVDTPGSGYIGAPIVAITGDGSGATAVAEVDYVAGVLTNIVVTSPGRGYTSALVTLTGGGGAGGTATATLAPAVSGGLTKVGAGTLTLSGANTFTGPVLVREGGLVNDGVFGGTVTIEAPGALDLGPGTEDLSIADTLTLAGTLYLDINRDTFASDYIFGPPSVILGGRLVVRNLGSAPQIGDGFWLIDAAAFSGAFAQLDLPPLDPTLRWDIPGLLATGVLEVKAAAPQTIASYQFNPATGFMELRFTGNPGYPYRIVATTNLTPPIVWETLGTETADPVTGLFGFTDTNAPAHLQRFYQFQFP